MDTDFSHYLNAVPDPVRRKRRKKADDIFTNPDQLNHRILEIINSQPTENYESMELTEAGFDALSNVDGDECLSTPDWDLSSISGSENDSIIDYHDFGEEDQPFEATEDVPMHHLVSISKLKSLQEVAKIASRHRGSNKLIEDILRLISLHIPASVNYPTTLYKFRKALHLNEKYYKVVYYCKLCWLELSVDLTCPGCGNGFQVSGLQCQRQYFLQFSLQAQLRQIFKLPFAQKAFFKFSEAPSSSSHCQAFKSSHKYLKICKGPHDITCTFNSDGVSCFKSNRRSIAPILFTINELPLHLSKKLYLLGGLWYGSKPEYKPFFRGLIQQMNSLTESGFSWETEDGASYQTLVQFVLSSVDSNARAPMQGMKQFNGAWGYNWCEHEGRSISQGRGSARVYIPGESCDNRRSDAVIRTETTNNIFQKGVLKQSPLLTLNVFDMVDGFCVDPLHSVYLGVTETLTELLINAPARAIYSLRPHLQLINHRLEMTKVPSEISRAFKPITKHSEWKGSDWRSWLFVLPVVLKGILCDRYLKHFSKLSRAMYLLSANAIPWKDVDGADVLLLDFVRGGRELYGDAFCTFNVHQLTHLAQHVRNWGPSWALGTFKFESINGELIRKISNINGLELQSAEKFVRQLLLLQYDKDLGIDRASDIPSIKNPKVFVPDRATSQLLSKLSFETIAFSKTVVIKGHEFKASRSTKRCDNILRITSNMLGAIRCFYRLFSQMSKERLLADIDSFMVSESPVNSQVSFVRSSSCRKRTLVDVSNLTVDKFFETSISDTQYFIHLPNIFEPL